MNLGKSAAFALQVTHQPMRMPRYSSRGGPLECGGSTPLLRGTA
jgi:hypothetical protein